MSASPEIDWGFIDAATGGGPGAIYTTCPACSESRRLANRRAKTLLITRPNDGYARYRCFHCEVSDWVRPDAPSVFRPRPRYRPGAPAKGRTEDDAAIFFAEFVFFGGGDLTGTPAESYLAGRKLLGGDDLKFSPLAPLAYDRPGHQTRTAPALLAGYRSPAGDIVAIEASYLSAAGERVSRKTWGRKAAGGAVRLAPAGDVLAVAEGVASALAFEALEGLPTWACLGAAGLAAFEPPAGVKHLVAAADHDVDGKGLGAARALAARVSVRVNVTIVMPAAPGADWADVLMERHHAG